MHILGHQGKEGSIENFHSLIQYYCFKILYFMCKGAPKLFKVILRGSKGFYPALVVDTQLSWLRKMA